MQLLGCLKPKADVPCVLAVCHRPHLSLSLPLYPDFSCFKIYKIHGGAKIFTDMETKELGQREAVSSQRLRF